MMRSQGLHVLLIHFTSTAEPQSHGGLSQCWVPCGEDHQIDFRHSQDGCNGSGCLENALLLSTSPLPPAPQTNTQPLGRKAAQAGNVNPPDTEPLTSKQENATVSPIFAINHLHTLKPEQNEADHSSDALTSQLQHTPAGRKLEKPFPHPVAPLQRGIPIELCSSKAGGISCEGKAEGQGNREGWGKEQRHGLGRAWRQSREALAKAISSCWVREG